MSFVPDNLLVTGGAGFIGANFVRHWLARAGAGRIIVYDALTYAGNQANLAGVDADPRYTFVRGDICDEPLVSQTLRAHRIDTIVNFAAESHVDRSILGPDDFVRTNVVGTHVLLKAAKALWLGEQRTEAHRFHHVSTDEVYGSLEPQAPAFAETTPYAPSSPYSATKAASDHLVRAYHHTYGLKAIITNCSNNYGPYQFPEKLIPLTIVNILSGKPLPVYGDGRQVRDWLHVSDHCAAIELALQLGKPGQTYNIGGASEIANIDLVRMICGQADELIGNDSSLQAKFPKSPAASGRRSEDLITHVTDRLGHDRRYAINFARAQRELGFRPSRDLASGLAATLSWYLANTAWWQALL
jgi:dTDP-glucose 4,6-dehydratase